MEAETTMGTPTAADPRSESGYAPKPLCARNPGSVGWPPGELAEDERRSLDGTHGAEQDRAVLAAAASLRGAFLAGGYSPREVAKYFLAPRLIALSVERISETLRKVGQDSSPLLSEEGQAFLTGAFEAQAIHKADASRAEVAIRGFQATIEGLSPTSYSALAGLWGILRGCLDGDALITPAGDLFLDEAWALMWKKAEVMQQ